MTAPTALATTPVVYPSTALPAGVAMDATNGNTYYQDGNTFLILKNGGGSSYTVTFTPVLGPLGLTLSTLVVTVAAGATALVPPLATGVFGTTVNMKASNAAVLASPMNFQTARQYS